MANYSATSKINLEVNGSQAKRMLDSLRNQADTLSKKMREASAAGDKVRMKKIQKDLNEVNNLMSKLTSETRQVEEVLVRLDKATPKELRKTLNTLQRQLQSIERGSEAWDKQTEKIRKVKAEIDKVNSSLREAEGPLSRFNNWWDKTQTVIMGTAAAIAGFVMAGRKAVNAYADMDQEMANVRKFTGMTGEEVIAMNEDLKKVDTRTFREELNKLAQEAGRLGKTEKEDVLGFVRAADKINVALDDLGEGATLTLSKLTGIFGDEKRLGTEKALLSVGSVINELSQNCSASAPYLAQFASRMGGVGAQAGMTVQQIMGFAAVLDSNNQALEASATALSQVIVRIYQEPAKYAKVAGLDVKKFSDLVKTDMNAAMIELLTNLNKAGSMDVLSPMFKNMGENGSRAISALSTLATHIDEVRTQQIVANQAFAEATSIDKEFDVQNNTVQAGLDKARKRVNELAVELGEKLAPVMKHVYSSSSMMLRLLSNFISFIVEYKREIAFATIGLATYSGAVLLYNTRVALATKTTLIFNNALKWIKSFSPAINLVFAGLTNAVNYFTNGLRVSYEMQLRWQKALNAMKLTSWVGVIMAAVSALLIFSHRLADNMNKLKAAREQMAKYRESIRDISKTSEEYYAKEISSLKFLYEAAIDESKSKEERIKAAQKLINTYPEQFKNMSAEQIMLGKAKTAYDNLTDSIILNAKAKAAADKVLENEKKILELEDTLKGHRKDYNDAESEIAKKQARNRAKDAKAHEAATTLTGAIAMQQGGTQEAYAHESTADDYKKRKIAGAGIISTKAEIRELNAANKEFTERYKNNKAFQEQMSSGVGDLGSEGDGDDGGGFSGGHYISDKERRKMEAEAKRAAIKARKEFKSQLDAIKADRDKELTSLMAQKSAGLINYQEYQEEKYKTEKKFYDDSIKLYEDWNIKEDDDCAALMKKREEHEAKWNEQRFAMNKDVIQRIAAIEEREAKVRYESKRDKTLADELQLQDELMDIRLKALKDEKSLYAPDSKEYVETERKIQDLLLSDKEAKQKMLMQKVKAFQSEFDKLSVKEKYDLELEALDTLYKTYYIEEEEFLKWKAALKKGYEKDSKDEKNNLPGKAPESAKVRAKKAREQYDDQKYSLDKALDKGIIDDKEYSVRLSRIKYEMNAALVDPLRTAQSEWVQMLASAYDAWAGFAEALKDPEADPFTAIADGITATAAIVNAIMQQITEFSKVEYEIQAKEVEKRYDREIKFAEGNAYLTKKLEKERQDELDRLKAEQSKKDFQMQVIAAIAQTAANAIQAYSAGLSIGGIQGLVMAPIAAAMAVAQGFTQIALLKKQQQAAAAVGYSEGGFTRPGAKDEPAGIVHAGEWVASQKLVNNPRTRPMIEFLEYAQRNNRIGSITMQDVSHSVAAPMFNAFAPEQHQQSAIVVQSEPATAQGSDKELSQAISRLNKRLDSPFVTVNSVTGEGGIREAQRKYDRIIRNKSRKKRS